MPGLVNAHVHLELSALRGETRSGGGFGPWVASMMDKRGKLLPEQDADAIEAAVSELLRTGTVAVGEVTQHAWPAVEALGTAPLLGRVFHEIFGMRRETADVMRRPGGAGAHEHQHLSSKPLVRARAPHAVLAASRERAGHRARQRARRAHQPTPVGARRRARVPARRRRPLRGLPRGAQRRPGRLASRPACRLWTTPGGSACCGPSLIAVHLCATTRDELRTVAESGAPVVLCPRSNLFIELKLPPLFDMLEVGLTPGLGTDSLASNTSLDVLAEACALHDRFPQVDAKLFLSMATWYGARALGLEHRVGALAPGLTPGLLAFDIERADIDPCTHLLRSPPPARRVLARPSMPTSSRPLGDSP